MYIFAYMYALIESRSTCRLTFIFFCAMLRIFMRVYFRDRIFMTLSNSLAAGNSGLRSLVRYSLAFNHHVVGLFDTFVVPVSVERKATPYSVYDIASP
ncbi:MAG TPA: hypothetical protein P5214_07190, partial [Rectinema sp.]|nr:hypothetical protein [Rectinema sp.]